jgi:hypothetical protein
LCSLKHGREQLARLATGCIWEDWTGDFSYYGRAQVGHLYFFGAALQTPQSVSAMVCAGVEAEGGCERERSGKY